MADAPDAAAEDAALARLTPREREVLTLIATGHDAKSAAAALGISVHTLNDRLLAARRKLGAGSSREAARRLAASRDGRGHEKSGPPFSGLAAIPPAGLDAGQPAPRVATARRWLSLSAGVLLMIFLTITAIALWSTPDADPAPAPAAAPQVVSTVPAAGAAVPPGEIDLIVRYDRPMRAGSMSYVQVSAESFPACRGTPRLLPDRRTFVWRCRIEAGRTYEIWLNREPYMNFRAEDGTPAQPHRLVFSGG